MDLVAKTLAGFEGILAAELNDLGAKEVKALKRAVSFKGDKKMLNQLVKYDPLHKELYREYAGN